MVHPAITPRTCEVCRKGEEEVTLQRCSTCKEHNYCSTACQRADWPTHKLTCKKPVVWYDKHRRCRDGNKHEGRLELITWSCPLEETGWGHVVENEAADFKRKFEVQYGGNEERFYKYWPQGFRWTCCGTDAGMDYGCDHHGSGTQPCTCDFCRMGSPLPERIYGEQSASRMGLALRRGPDRRSFNAGLAAMSATMRTMMGLEM